MDGFLWWLGWRLKAAFVLSAAFGAGLVIAGGSAVVALAGSLLPLAFWAWSTKSINGRWPSLLQGVESAVHRQGQKWLHLADGEFQAYLLTEESPERSTLIQPARGYRYTGIYVTAALLGIYSGSRYDAVARRFTAGSDTKEIYFKQIAGIDYRPGEIEIKTLGSQPFRLNVRSQEVAHAIVGQIRGKLRTVHA